MNAKMIATLKKGQRVVIRYNITSYALGTVTAILIVPKKVRQSFLDVQSESGVSLRFDGRGLALEKASNGRIYQIVGVPSSAPGKSKAEQVLRALLDGRGVQAVARELGTVPTTVAQIAARAGIPSDYMDLYTGNGPHLPQHEEFEGVLRFASVPDAEKSAAKIQRMIRSYVKRGMPLAAHRARYTLLVGRDLAMGSGKAHQAGIFAQALVAELMADAYMAMPAVWAASKPR